MAIDQTLVALDIAGTTVTKAGELVMVLQALKAEYDHGLAAGINLTNYDTVFDIQEPLKHVDGTTLNKVLGIVVVNLLNYLNTTMSGTDNYMQILQKARR